MKPLSALQIAFCDLYILRGCNFDILIAAFHKLYLMTCQILYNHRIIRDLYPRCQKLLFLL